MFVPATDLKRHYCVKGRFYRIEYDDDLVARCRSTLEIFTHEVNIQDQEPDAYVVMENPGSSRSIEMDGRHIDGPIYSSRDVNLAQLILRTPLTRAKPDTTQYQIMRLMRSYGWNFVRVLNLSDLRNTNGDRLIREYQQLNDPYLSFFSDCREEERVQFLVGIENKPVIVAWGVKTGLRELATQAMAKLPVHIRGLPGVQPYMFQHPWPRKGGAAREWLERFLQEVHF